MLCKFVKTLLWVVVSNMFYFHPYLGKISNLTNIFQRGWNHQLVLQYAIAARPETNFFRKRELEKPVDLVVVELWGCCSMLKVLKNELGGYGMFTYIWLIFMVNVYRWIIVSHQWVVFSNIFLSSPRKLGKILILTHIFQMGWRHQLEKSSKKMEALKRFFVWHQCGKGMWHQL